MSSLFHAAVEQGCGVAHEVPRQKGTGTLLFLRDCDLCTANGVIASKISAELTAWATPVSRGVHTDSLLRGKPSSGEHTFALPTSGLSVAATSYTQRLSAVCSGEAFSSPYRSFASP